MMIPKFSKSQLAVHAAAAAFIPIPTAILFFGDNSAVQLRVFLWIAQILICTDVSSKGIPITLQLWPYLANKIDACSHNAPGPHFV